MIKQLTATAIIALGLASGPAQAAGDGGHVHDTAFSFEWPFGKYDQEQLRRGLKVYTEVCAACHGLRYVPLRTLSDPGGPEYTEDEVRA
jgi:ubiquinol-cytochrome c reductase cytochrome c1 subunit